MGIVKENVKPVLFKRSDLWKVASELEKRDGNEIIFFLPNNQYGYGYSYKEEHHTSLSFKDRFSKDELLNIDDIVAKSNNEAYLNYHINNTEAVLEVLYFWTGIEKGCYLPDISMEQAIEYGRSLELDFIII